MSNTTIIPVSLRVKNQLSAVLLTGITVYFPNAHKTWFVEESGNIHIAPAIGLVIAIGLLMQKQWARKAGLIAGFFLAIIALYLMTSLPDKPGYALMLLCGGLLIVLLRPNHT